MEELVINLVVGAVMGGIVAAIANSKGRNALGWFFIGMFTGCIGLILVLVLPDEKKRSQDRVRLRRENRKLREELQLNRNVADKRHAETSRRLQAHDRALGVSTSRRKKRRRIEAAPVAEELPYAPIPPQQAEPAQAPQADPDRGW